MNTEEELKGLSVDNWVDVALCTEEHCRDNWFLLFVCEGSNRDC